MRVSSRLLTIAAGLLILVACVSSAPDVQARPQYLKLFIDGYPKVSNAATAKKCATCHEKKDKKKRLPYGKAVESALGAKNEKNELKIVAAFKKAEKSKGKDGKTFGEMLQNGELPE